MKDPHNLGEFENLEKVWDLYPSGGCPGDYVLVGGEKIYWNTMEQNWGDSGIAESGGKNERVEGDLTVTGNLTVGEKTKGKEAEFGKLKADKVEFEGDPFAPREHKHCFSDIEGAEDGNIPGKIENAAHADKAHDLDEDSPVWDKVLRKDVEDRAREKIVFEKGAIFMSELTARQIRSSISMSLMEGGEPKENTCNAGIVEEGENPEVMSMAVTEEPAPGYGFEGGTLGEMDNVDFSFDTLPAGQYMLDKRQDGVFYPVKASAVGGGGSSLTLTYVSAASATVLPDNAVKLEYNFKSVDTADKEDTGPGTAIYRVNDVKVATEVIQQGNVTWDCSAYLTVGDNTVSVNVADSYGKSRTLTFTVKVISLGISSNFDEYLPYSGEISFRYTPVGELNKEVIFKVDGKVVATVSTEVNNRQMTQAIPAQTHGAHLLEVYMEAVVGNGTVSSNVLRYALVCMVEGNNTPIIASVFSEATVEQYRTMSIPFMVYNPVSSTASVVLKANGVAVSEQVVDRGRQVWNYRADVPGDLTLTIACGEVWKTFAVNVSASGIEVSAETQGLELYLTAVGRSNNEAHPSEWKYKEIASSLTGFNFVTNGWIADEQGIVSLKVSGDARVEIPFKLFGKDFRSTGKTIEFEFATMDVANYEAVVVECMSGGRGLQITAQKAVFISEQSRTETNFKEDERVRVAFAVEDTTENRLLYTYINGKISGVIQYPADDNFRQAAPVDIRIGSNDCTVCLHTIRVYDSGLNLYQLLDNYIADMDDVDRKITLYERNRVFDGHGNLSYGKVLNQLPGLTIIGELPQFKGDKKIVTLVYEDKKHPERSWRAENVQIDVQGTSSQYYPRKNYKVKCKEGFIMTLAGEHVEKVAIREGEIPVNCFCFKADFAESSGVHNTGMAKLIERLLKSLNILTPPQQEDGRVRTTIDGYPIVIFYRTDEGEDSTFLGKYNFNNDKSTLETFGFTPGCESWEIKNNTSDRVLFLSSDYEGEDADGNPDWLNDFEARYPEDNTDPSNLKRLTDWIASTKGNAEKFKAECADYFDLNSLLFYYLITELFAMVDQRAKNMFLTTYDGVHWRVIFYDNDTVCGINNEGAVAFGYDVEYHDKLGAGQVFNGESSVLWNNVEACYATEIAGLYQRLRSQKLLSYDKVIEVLNGEQSDKWCESIYNEDGRFKYILPLIEMGNGSYLYALQGSREEHRKWWLYNRFRYMDSKYVAGDFKSDYVTMRLYTPNDYAGVVPDADFTITPYSGQYVNVKYGSYLMGKRGKKGVPMVIEAPKIQFNDTETIVYGASGIQSLGDLSGKYAGTVDISMATKLVELVAGSAAAGYHNDNLTVLSIGTNKLFRKLDVRNCPRLAQPIDVSGCESIEEVYAQGTSVSAVRLPAAGVVRELHLPSTVTNLTVRNQSKLTDEGFSMQGTDRVATLIWENTPGVDVFALLEGCRGLQRVRLVNVNGNGTDLSLLVRMAGIAGIDGNGNSTEKAVITGTYHVQRAEEGKLVQVIAAFPELAVTYDTWIPIPTRTIVVRKYNTLEAIPGATVVINGLIYTANDNGEVSFRSAEAVTVTASALDYGAETVEFAEIDTERTNYIYIYPVVNVTFTVKSEDIVLPGAVVTVEGQSLIADEEGIVVFRLSKKTYSYKAVYGKYLKESAFTVNDLDVNYAITIDVPYEEWRPAKNGNIQMALSGTSVSLSVSSGFADYMIDWGDGSTTAASGTGAKTYPHTYAKADDYNVEVRGCENVTACNADSATLKAYWSIGDSKVSNLGFKNYKKLKAVGGDIFKYDIARKSFDSCFYYCSALQSIPAGLFDNCPNVITFSSCFYSCSNLQMIPLGLFDNCPAVTTFSSCFYSCLGIISVLPGLWVIYYEKSMNGSSCFRGCSSAENWAEVPSDWGGPAGKYYDEEVCIQLFKDKEWYLNQEVSILGEKFKQEADGTYLGRLKGPILERETDVVVNGVTSGFIIASETRLLHIVCAGNCGSILFETGSNYKDYVVENTGFTSLNENGLGFSTYDSHDCHIDLLVGIGPHHISGYLVGSYLYIEDSLGNIIGGLQEGKEDTYVYSNTEVIRIRSTQSFSSGSIRRMYVKKITNIFEIPPIPQNFLPAIFCNGVVMADYRALEIRLRNVEEKLNLNN